MLGAGLQFSRCRGGEDRFYTPPQARRNHHTNNNSSNNKSSNNQYENAIQKNSNHNQLWRAHSDASTIPQQHRERAKLAAPASNNEAVNRTEETRKPVSLSASDPAISRLSNVERFLEAITPSIPAQYLPKTITRRWRRRKSEFQTYFLLSDLWESFKEWSAYGAGVPLVLNHSDSVVQYYVPYLSGIQLYVDRSKYSVRTRRTGEDSDANTSGRDSSSDGSSDTERERGLIYTSAQRNSLSHTSGISHELERLSLMDRHNALQEGFSSDEGESDTPQHSLIFEYFECVKPFCREPLADKVSALASCFPELKTLRSCDLLPSSWVSVAWYPIYRIPTGPTLKDLEACFLTYHSLHSHVGVPDVPAPVVTYPDEIDGAPKISLPVFGLYSYKFTNSEAVWTNNGSVGQLVNTLSQAAENWLKLMQVNHPDHVFFRRYSS